MSRRHLPERLPLVLRLVADASGVERAVEPTRAKQTGTTYKHKSALVHRQTDARYTNAQREAHTHEHEAIIACINRFQTMHLEPRHFHASFWRRGESGEPLNAAQIEPFTAVLRDCARQKADASHRVCKLRHADGCAHGEQLARVYLEQTRDGRSSMPRAI